MSFSNLSLTPSERHAFSHYYNLAEKGAGVVNGDSAVAFFSYSGLKPLQLGQIWQLADSNNNGFLDQPSFSVALRLIGHVQNNEIISEDLINKPGPIPTFDGISLPTMPTVTSPTNVTSPNPSSPVSSSMPPIKVDDRSRFTRIFAGCGPINGLISGDKARDIFIKSKLSFEVLGQIWNLADTQSRGSLDLTDFIIGMHFIQCYMNKTITQLPQMLPPGFYEQASGGRQRSQSPLVSSPQKQFTGSQTSSPPPSRQVRFATVGGGTESPRSPIGTPPVQSPSGLTASLPTATTNTVNSHPDEISAEEKSGYDAFFDGLDPSGQGLLEADKSVEFFSKSGLPVETLASIWDLADIRKLGKLTKDEFAIAMHLIHSCLNGIPVPNQLPESLIPPNLRSSAPRKPADDLFDLMGDETDLQPAVVQPQFSGNQPTSLSSSTGLQPQGTGTSLQQHVTGLQQTNSLQPQGTGLQSQITGWQNPPQQQSRSPFDTAPIVSSPVQSQPTSTQPALVDDLLGDTDVQQSKLESDSAAVNTAKSQLSETDRALSDYQTRRADLETRVSAAENERKELEQRLTNARKAYDIETKLVSDLQVKLTETTSERRKLEQELITAESDCSAQKVERAELETNYMREKEETRVIKAKILEINNHTTEIRQALADIQDTNKDSKSENTEAKEQLKNAETDRDAAATELKRYSNVDPKEMLPPAEADLNEKLKDIEASKEEPKVDARSLETPEIKEPQEKEGTTSNATEIPLPVSPESKIEEEKASDSNILSPVSTKSNNPFEKLTPAALNSSSPQAPTQDEYSKETSEVEDPFALEKPADEGKNTGNFSSFNESFDKFDFNENLNKNNAGNGGSSDFDDAFVGFDNKISDSKAAFDESFSPSMTASNDKRETSTASPFDNFKPTVESTLPSKGKEREDDSSDDNEGPEELPQLSEQPPNLNPKNDFDDFDDAFATFSPQTSNKQPPVPSNVETTPKSNVQPNKNPFEVIMNNNDKKEDNDEFDASFADLPAAQIAAGNVGGETNEFDNDDSAFDFVADFDQPNNSNNNHNKPQQAAKELEDFSDTFSVKSPQSENAHLPTTTKPTLPPRSQGAEDDDVKQVKQLVNMGFDREQAIKALEKSGYNFEKALNKLLK